MQEKTLKKDSYFIEKALQTPFTQKFGKSFEVQDQKAKPKLKTNRK